jgi:hypothetical protein
MSKAKISELENVQSLNRKYLLDEELNKKIQEKELKKLNEDLDNLSKLSEETMKQLIKENEVNQAIIIRNNISNNEAKMNLLLQKFKEEEQRSRDLLEEKNITAQKIVPIFEDNENQIVKEKELKIEMVDLKNSINQLEIVTEENQNILENLESENGRIKIQNEKLEIDIKSINKKIEEIQQKIELNSILRDVDVNELKMLCQNNAIVNNSINSLMSKWDNIQGKLKEMERNKNDDF